ncbi:hypothetical protein [Barrientosiimonas humi]|uniref:hypothetical protein n=1 Tax=Barrientosiimonas humi TaxID=999931 RepID=UPI00370D66B7
MRNEVHDPQPAEDLRRAVEARLAVPAERELWLTRDSRPTTYGGLVGRAGEPTARWVLLRSSDGRQLDVAWRDLPTQTLRNPAFAVVLAHARLVAGVQVVGLERPLDRADSAWGATARTGRTRILATAVEAVAAVVLAAPAVPRAGLLPEDHERARIVLASALRLAGMPAPTHV